MRFWVLAFVLLVVAAALVFVGVVFLGWGLVSSSESGSVTSTTHVSTTSTSSTTTLPGFTMTTLASSSGGGISVASWNLQAFGPSKAADDALMRSYVEKMRLYDIVVIQEIRDASGTAFPKLCNLMAGYACLNSSRAGNTSSKEQYGVIYRNVELLGVHDYNSGAYTGQFNRPPFSVSFRAGNWSFTLVTEHTDPDNVPAEMNALEAIVTSDYSGQDAVVLGDLNGDCSYYHTPPANLKGWTWEIPDSEDTTVAATKCAYDRIILSPGAARHFVNYSIMRDVSKEQSDHYLVSGVFNSAVG